VKTDFQTFKSDVNAIMSSVPKANGRILFIEQLFEYFDGKYKLLAHKNESNEQKIKELKNENSVLKAQLKREGLFR